MRASRFGDQGSGSRAWRALRRQEGCGRPVVPHPGGGGTVNRITAPSRTLDLQWERTARESGGELAMEQIIYILIAIVVASLILACLNWHPGEEA